MKKLKHQSIIRLLGVIAIILGSNLEGVCQASNWVFGENTMINFYEGQAHPSITPDSISVPFGVSAISNENGQLIFFSDGTTAKDHLFNIIKNGDSLVGNRFATQSSIIVPKPGTTEIYYLFTVDMYVPPVYTNGINYSILEFPSIGDTNVVYKNSVLLTENAQKITAVKHANKNDYWIVTHGFGENKGATYYSFLLTGSGLITTPVTTTIGHPHSGDVNNGRGSMKISPDGSKLALVIPADGIVEVYDFSAETGKVSSLKTSDSLQFCYASGIEFSPDNSKLYFSITPINEDTNYIYQLDLNLTNPFSNPVIIHQSYVNYTGSADSTIGDLQLGIDGKIYVAKSYRANQPMSNLGVIYNPNRPGIACNYNQINHSGNNGLYLEGGGSMAGLPNFVSTFLDIPHYYNTELCDKDTVIFTIRNTANIDDVSWDFGNPEGSLIINNLLAPGFVFSDSGNYELNLTEYFDTEQYNYPRSIKINPLPEAILAGGNDTVYFYENSTITLDAGEWDNYEWQPGGSTERYLDVTTEGYYSVTITDSNCCRNTDTVHALYITSIDNIGSISEYVRVFPNPTKGEFNIVVQGLEGNLDISITSIIGENYYKENDVIINNKFIKLIDITSLPNGIYLLKLSHEKGTFHSKLIKH